MHELLMNNYTYTEVDFLSVIGAKRFGVLPTPSSAGVAQALLHVVMWS